MKLEKLSLTNFRGFESLELEFEPDVTIIAGINGLGKSSILNALAITFSRALREITPSKAQRLSFLKSDIHYVSESMHIECGFTYNNRPLYFNSNVYSYSRLIEKIERYEEINLELTQLNKIKNDIMVGIGSEEFTLESLEAKMQILGQEFFSLTIDGFKDVYYLGEKSGKDSYTTISYFNYKIIENHGFAVYYSSQRHTYKYSSRTTRLEPSHLTGAYTNALNDKEMNFKYFLDWWAYQTRFSVADQMTLIKSLEKIVILFLEDVLEVRVYDINSLKLVVKKRDSVLELNQLSDGERSIINIIFDLTRRITIANPTLKNPVSDGQAIVMIDEIELHLHPDWQRRVLYNLTNTFKNCQFIVTTHSPQIIGEAEGRCIRYLERDENGRVQAYTPEQAFGLDSNRILEDMGGSSRNDWMNENLSLLFEKIDDENFDEARAQLEQIRSRIKGDDPELTRANTLMAFLEDTNEEHHEGN